MTEYELWVSGHGLRDRNPRFIDFLDAVDDDEALAAAENIAHQRRQAIDVYQGERKVATVLP